MNTYVISDFCHFVDVGNDKIAMYNALTLGVIFINSLTADKLKSSQGGVFSSGLFGKNANSIIDALLERRLIYPLGERYDLEDYQRMHGYMRENNFSIMYLLTTDGCNLSCRYCYVNSNIPKDYKYSMMSIETIDRAFNLFIRSNEKSQAEPNIILYGGEPLLNKSVVKHVIDKLEYLRSSNEKFRDTVLTINTNATLIDDEYIEIFRGKKINIAVSLDGRREAHDSMRVFKDGKGSFDKVMENCHKMRKFGVSFGFSVTITNANIFDLEDTLLWIYEQFNIKSIGFNIAIYRPEEIIGMSYEEYAKLVTEKLISCFKICRSKGIYEDRIMRKVESFVKGDVYVYDCGAQGNQMVVTPDGQVGICAAYCGSREHFVPMEALDNVTEHEIWKTWQYRTPLYQKQCYNCIALGTCGGGCAYSAEMMDGNIWGIDKVFCYYSKKALEFLIKDLYEKTLNP